MTSDRPKNRLASETSPYLRGHAENPVDWYPWGEEALSLAKRENRPIFLSIGYSTCHWCHVMERESFENEDTAGLLNEHFVCIKVDREERPDIDEIYMTATLTLSGNGGWPMSVFLMPDRTPFYAGTYFPPEDAYGRPGFRTLLQRIIELWQTDRASVAEQATQLTQAVTQQLTAPKPAPLAENVFDVALRALAQSFDSGFGGFGQAPKFPPCTVLSLLMRRYQQSGREELKAMVIATLDGMKNGGMYDHLAGGFARYSTDDRWLVPHFEKMLYDNAQLAVVYLEAYQLTGFEAYRDVGQETLDYVLREMEAEIGGYFTATDADSEGVEGKFFVFTKDEVDAVLTPEQSRAFSAYYDVTQDGNWEGTNILNTPRRKSEVATELGPSLSEFNALLQTARSALYDARQRREKPLLDDKFLANLNGLMVSAMAMGYRVLLDERYLFSAERALTRLRSELYPQPGQLHHAMTGKGAIPGFLEDYAYVARGALDAYEVSGKASWLELSEALAKSALTKFGAQAPTSQNDGALFNTSSEHDDLIARACSGQDGATPNPNGVLAHTLYRLSRHLDRPQYQERADALLTAFGQQVNRFPRPFASLLIAQDFRQNEPLECVLIGARKAPDLRPLRALLARRYLPNALVVEVDPADQPAAVSPLVAGKLPRDGAATAYLCRGGTCGPGICDPDELSRQLTQVQAGARANA